PTIITISNIDHVAFLGTINPDTDKITKHLFQVYFFQAKDGIRAGHVTGVQTCALPISQLIECLAAAGIPAPSPVPRVDGRGFTALHPSTVGGRPVALFPWQEGEILCQARVTPTVTARVGHALARVHLALASVREPRPGRFRLQDLRARLQAIGRAPDAELRSLAPAITERLDRAAAARNPALPGG